MKIRPLADRVVIKKFEAEDSPITNPVYGIPFVL